MMIATVIAIILVIAGIVCAVLAGLAISDNCPCPAAILLVVAMGLTVVGGCFSGVGYYRTGQIDAANGIMLYELQTQDDGSTKWVRKADEANIGSTDKDTREEQQ